MLNENIRMLRKAKEYSQEEVASRLNVARQTISNWEKGYSVPDADMLSKLAEVFEVPVSKLLGETISSESEPSIAEMLSRINEQMAIKNRRSKRIWTIVVGIIIAIILLMIFSSAA